MTGGRAHRQAMDKESLGIDQALSMMSESPRAAAKALKRIARTVSAALDKEPRELRKSHSRLLDDCKSHYRHASILAVMQKALRHITNIRTTALFTNEEWDSSQCTQQLLEENKKAKKSLFWAENLAESHADDSLREEILDLEQQRALELAAAMDRIVNHKMKIIASAYSYDSQEESPDVLVFADVRIRSRSFLYWISVKNNSEYVITDATVSIVSYPQDCMRLMESTSKSVRRLEIGGVRGIGFELQPTKDCVEGKITAILAYVDHKDLLHTIALKPYTIKSVCDLLQAKEVSEDDFDTSMKNLISRSQTVKLYWNADVLIQKMQLVLSRMNFYLVSVSSHSIGRKTIGRVQGYALGKYTGKRVAVVLNITGTHDEQESSIEVIVAGDDEAMLPTTTEELTEKLGSWTCLKCGAPLNAEQVPQIAKGGVVECRYCHHVLTADLYCRSGNTPQSTAKMVEKQPDPHPMFKTADDEAIEDAFVSEPAEGVYAYRGCEAIGGAFQYKVKVENTSKFVITNVTVTIASYPNDSLLIEGARVKSVPRVEVGGYRSLQFKFQPTKDCVQGKIIAAIAFIDHKDCVHTLRVKPYTLRSVCDLLKPLKTSSEEWELFLRDVGTSDKYFTIDLNPNVVLAKILDALPARNFFVMDSDIRKSDTDIVAVVRGFAQGKYTSKRIAIEVLLSGPIEGLKTEVALHVLGDDASMFPTVIAELSHSFETWECLHCGGVLTPEQVFSLKSLCVVTCSKCGHSLSLDLYFN